MDNLPEDLRAIVHTILETATMTTSNEATKPQGATRNLISTPPRQVIIQDDESPIQITARRRRKVVQEVCHLHADVLSGAGSVYYDMEVLLEPGGNDRCRAGNVHMDGSSHVFPHCGRITTSHRMAISREKRRSKRVWKQRGH